MLPRTNPAAPREVPEERMRSRVPELKGAPEPTEETLRLHQVIAPSSSTAQGCRALGASAASVLKHRQLTGSFPKVEFLLTVWGN